MDSASLIASVGESDASSPPYQCFQLLSRSQYRQQLGTENKQWDFGQFYFVYQLIFQQNPKQTSTVCVCVCVCMCVSPPPNSSCGSAKVDSTNMALAWRQQAGTLHFKKKISAAN